MFTLRLVVAGLVGVVGNPMPGENAGKATLIAAELSHFPSHAAWLGYRKPGDVGEDEDVCKAGFFVRRPLLVKGAGVVCWYRVDGLALSIAPGGGGGGSSEGLEASTLISASGWKQFPSDLDAKYAEVISDCGPGEESKPCISSSVETVPYDSFWRCQFNEPRVKDGAIEARQYLIGYENEAREPVYLGVGSLPKVVLFKKSFEASSLKIMGRRGGVVVLDLELAPYELEGETVLDVVFTNSPLGQVTGAYCDYTGIANPYKEMRIEDHFKSFYAMSGESSPVAILPLSSYEPVPPSELEQCEESIAAKVCPGGELSDVNCMGVPSCLPGQGVLGPPICPLGFFESVEDP